MIKTHYDVNNKILFYYYNMKVSVGRVWRSAKMRRVRGGVNHDPSDRNRRIININNFSSFH